MKKLISILLLLIFATPLFAVVNFPFPQNTTYNNGIIAGSVNTADLKSDFQTWWGNYYEESGSLGRIKFDDDTKTVSEGIGYGMLMTVYMSDNSTSYQSQFDKLWAYYNHFANSNGVMNWKINGFSSVAENNGATDAELDVAVSLVMAYYQFGNEQYKTDALSLIHKIKSYEVDGNNILKPGDAWNSKKNPSYFSLFGLKLFAEFDTDNTSFWNSVISATFTDVLDNQSSTGISSDWYNPDNPNDVLGTNFSYDAARTPWRISLGYYWYGSNDAVTYLTKTANQFKNTSASDIRDGYNMDGSVSGQYNNSAFIGGIGSSFGVSSSYQSKLNEYYNRLADNMSYDLDNSYYNGALNIIYRLAMSGNMPNFEATSSTPNNAPEITAQANSLTVDEDSSLTIVLSDVTATDADGDSLTLVVQSGTNYTKNGNEITPSLNFNGTLTVPVKVSDGTDLSDAYNLTVTVNSINDAPVFSSSIADTSLDSGNVLTKSLPVSDVDDTALQLEILENTSSMNASLENNERVDVSFNADVVGTYSIKLRIYDDENASDTIVYTVNVTRAGIVTDHGPLETIDNIDYLYFTTSGTNAPDFSHVTKFTINWNNPNNSVYTFSANFDQDPNYTDLKSTLTQFWQTKDSCIISGASDIPNFDGTYHVYLESPGNLRFDNINGDDYVIMHEDAPTTVEEVVEENSDQLTIYPNPAIDIINVRSSIDGEIVIMNLQGKVVEFINNNRANVSKLSKGIYFAVVKENGKIKAVKSFYKR